MMLLFLLAQAAAPAPASSVPSADAAVMTHQLETWRGSIRSDKTGTTCITKQSSGDPDLDAVACTSMQRCWPDMMPRIAAMQTANPADRQRLAADAANAFTACAKPKREASIQALAAHRAAARRQGQ